MSKYLGFDPAGNSFGIVGVILENGQLSVNFSFLLNAPEDFNTSQKNSYMAHGAATVVALYKPDMVISEAPFGIGWSAQYLKELIGAIKAELACNVIWQGVSQARKSVIGDGYGGAKKLETAKWLLNYNWDRSSKMWINKEIEAADPTSDKGFDLLDALLHVICYLVENGLIQPVHKPTKEKRKKV